MLELFTNDDQKYKRTTGIKSSLKSRNLNDNKKILTKYERGSRGEGDKIYIKSTVMREKLSLLTIHTRTT